MAARDQALLGEHSNPDSVAISIPEDFTKSVSPQVGLVLHPACACWTCGASDGNSCLVDAQSGRSESLLQCSGDRELELRWGQHGLHPAAQQLLLHCHGCPAAY